MSLYVNLPSLSKFRAPSLFEDGAGEPSRRTSWSPRTAGACSVCLSIVLTLGLAGFSGSVLAMPAESVPAAEFPSEPGVESASEPASEPLAEPPAGPAAEPAAESGAEPTPEPTGEPAGPVVESGAEPSADPAVGPPVIGPAIGPLAGSGGEPEVEPAAQSPPDGAETSVDPDTAGGESAGEEPRDEGQEPTGDDSAADDEATTDGETTASEEEEAAVEQSWRRNAWVQLPIFFLVIALPLGLAHLMKKAWRMPEYFTKFALILFCMFAGVAVIVLGWPPTLGIDLAGGSILTYELKESGEATAANQIDVFVDAAAKYEGDTGSPPSTQQGLQALLEDPGVSGWNGPYVTELPKDPWGSDYHYEKKGDSAKPLVWSTGDNRETDDPEAEDEKKDDVTSETRAAVKKVDMEALRLAIYKRVDPTGTSEIDVRLYGARHIRVTIPNADEGETERIKRKISTAGTLEFRIVANHRDHPDEIKRALAAPESDILVSEIRGGEERRLAWWVRVAESAQEDYVENLFVTTSHGVGYVDGRFVDVDINGKPVAGVDDSPFRGATQMPADQRSMGIRSRPDSTGRERLEILLMNDSLNVTGEYLTSSRRGADESGADCVQFNFNVRGGHLFSNLTGDNLPDENPEFHRLLAIVLEEELASAPRINSIIRRHGIITGRFSREEVDDLVAVLNAGGLGADLSDEPISTYYAGPLLGHDTILKGGITIAASLALVLIFMMVYYRFSGIVACFAVLLNLVLILALMILFNAAFTLPGIAGLVLTVGMAVDANVLIFERIREELNRGATLRMAIRNGFQRATTTVVDANLTTLIVGFVLYAIGTEQVKGFAVILILGVALSMFTAIFCARVVFDVAERRRWRTNLHMMRLIGKTEYDFVGMRRVAGVISLIVILAGLGGVVYRQKGLLDIDFIGGVEVEIVFKDKQDINDVRKALSEPSELNELSEELSELGKLIEQGELSDLSDLSGMAELSEELRDLIDLRELSELSDLSELIELSKLSKLPDLAVVNVTNQENPEPGFRFLINTSQPEHTTPEQYLTHIKELLNDRFDNLAHYEMIRQSEPIEQSGDEPSPLGEPTATPEPAEETRVDLPSNSLLASADPSAVLLAQADTTPAELPTTSQPPAIDIAEPASQEALAESLKFPRGMNYDTLLSYFDNWKASKTEAGQSDWDSLQYQLSNPTHDEMIRREGEDGSRYEDWAVTISNVTPGMAEEMLAAIQSQVESVIYFPSSNTVGGAVAQRTQTQALTALMASLLCIVGYIKIRFQRMMFGLAAVVALVHDVLITLGALALSSVLAPVFGFIGIVEFKIGLPVLAAFLTIIGYSLNDTIVVFDRIREVRGKSPSLTPEMVNKSINQTLARTLLTSLTTLIVVALLYIFGGARIHTFAFALVVGVLVGTYSSIFVASPVLLWMAQATGVPKKKGA